MKRSRTVTVAHFEPFRRGDRVGIPGTGMRAWVVGVKGREMTLRRRSLLWRTTWMFRRARMWIRARLDDVVEEAWP